VGHDSAPLEYLLGLLDLEPIGPGPDSTGSACFRGRPPREGTIPVYGGHLAAQALAAAGRTVSPARHPSSLHSYFLRPAHPKAPIDYRVDTVSDTQSFAARRVSAAQGGREVFSLAASFHQPEAGPSHQDPMPEVPDPETLPTYEERLTKALGQHVEPLGKPYELRFVGPLSLDAARDPALRSSRTRVWVRTDGQFPAAATDEHPQLFHSCLAAYISDSTLMETVLTGLGLSWLTDVTRAGSLDHAMWFHRPFRADEWLLYDQRSPVTSGARALVGGRLFTRDGRLVASCTQEVLLRVAPGAHRPSATD
jgi:acyl-CoA thioesterase II